MHWMVLWIPVMNQVSYSSFMTWQLLQNWGVEVNERSFGVATAARIPNPARTAADMTKKFFRFTGISFFIYPDLIGMLCGFKYGTIFLVIWNEM